MKINNGERAAQAALFLKRIVLLFYSRGATKE